MLLCGRYELDTRSPLVMGIVNVTPDSFSDGGRYTATDAAIAHGRALAAAGAHILDIGGESTRPGAQTVPDEHEIARVAPILEGLREAGVPLSVDTRKPAVMRAALAAGADMLNDISGFTHPEALAAAAAHPRCGLVAMHMHGEPTTMQQSPPDYADVVAEVAHYLSGRCAALRAAGVAAARIAIDPGLGFGKTVEHNYRLLARLDALCALGYPVLVGLSRKSMIGAVTGKPVGERLAGSIAGALAAVAGGAAIVRVHDVAETVDALAVWAEVARLRP
ncbi:dihydropteroate synthase [Verticiella sediminum]|uniref:Dihydropteroate synthase n=1 Tax=Verticiella sediminum TaxID=1247510 RepID=A0A556ABP8_9BURK|nr:dihydropteroate synthase [Verticiella sediminum]TSH90300.1 dihydropteroate synthase [Verticiella sediminum]